MEEKKPDTQAQNDAEVFDEVVTQPAEKPQKKAHGLIQFIWFILMSLIAFALQMLIAQFGDDLLALCGVSNSGVFLTVGLDELTLAGFIAFLVANIVAKVISYILNRKKTFAAVNNLAFSFSVYVIMCVALIVAETFIAAPIQGMWIDVGVPEDIAGMVTVITYSIPDFLIVFLMEKFVIMNNKLFAKKKEEDAASDDVAVAADEAAADEGSAEGEVVADAVAQDAVAQDAVAQDAVAEPVADQAPVQETEEQEAVEDVAEAVEVATPVEEVVTEEPLAETVQEEEAIEQAEEKEEQTASDEAPQELNEEPVAQEEEAVAAPVEQEQEVAAEETAESEPIVEEVAEPEAEEPVAVAAEPAAEETAEPEKEVAAEQEKKVAAKKAPAKKAPAKKAAAKKPAAKKAADKKTADKKTEKKAPAKKEEPKEESAANVTVLFDAPETEGPKGKFVVIKDELNPDRPYKFQLKANNGQVLYESESFKIKPRAKQIEVFRNTINNGTFSIDSEKNGTFRYKLFKADGSLYGVGEGYKTRQSAESALESVKNFCNTSNILEDTTVEENK